MEGLNEKGGEQYSKFSSRELGANKHQESFSLARVNEAAKYVLEYPTMGVRLLLAEFRGLPNYPEAKIQQAAKDVADKKNKIEEWNRKNGIVPNFRAEAMEEILGSRVGSDECNWFSTIRTTELDDYHGYDGVTEFKGNHGRIDRLIVDVTTSINSEVIKTKFEQNISKILNNTLRVEFFKSRLDVNFQKPLWNCISAVIGVDRPTTDGLIVDFAELTRLQNKENKNDGELKQIEQIKDKIANNPAQIIVLEEMKLQAQMYKNIIINRGDEENVRVDIGYLDNIIGDINGLLTDKNDLIGKFGNEIKRLKETDGVYREIAMACEKYGNKNTDLSYLVVERDVSKVVVEKPKKERPKLWAIKDDDEYDRSPLPSMWELQDAT